MSKPHSHLDVIGQWSEIKLEIIDKYATAYSRILSSKKLEHVYIDGFAGAGVHISKATRELVKGTPIRALSVNPPFRKYYLIDLDEERVGGLKELAGNQPDVVVLQGDCNELLLSKVFPNVKYDQYRRGLCILDPYGLHLDWKVIQQAGEMGTIDLFLNFPIMDMNMNVLFHDPSKVEPSQVARMNRFWGDESWREAIYTTTATLFGYPEKESNEVLIEAFKVRLRDTAKFKRVPEPMPMRNSTGAVVYYLFFAAQVDVAEHIVTDIFKKHR